jgi:hypothetical protein
MSYLKQYLTAGTPQLASLPGRGQTANSAGGSCHASEGALTRENTEIVARCLTLDGARTVAEIVSVSRDGRAPKQGPTLYALAMAAGLGDEPTRRLALEALGAVARTGTQLFTFAAFVEGFRGWGRSLRRAVGRWYTARPADELAYQAVKYRMREGFTHRDLLRLAHRVSRSRPATRRWRSATSTGGCSSGSSAAAMPLGRPGSWRGSSPRRRRGRRPRRRGWCASTGCRVRRSTRST